jgi:hypothetical protein
VLSLADNYISHLRGLAPLRQLRELNAARNDISEAATALAGCGQLAVLNLAANRIASFQVGARAQGATACSCADQLRRRLEGGRLLAAACSNG